MKGLFIPDITAEMFKNGCLESIEALMTAGEIYDIEYQQWIPCSERLPEYGEAVLTVNEDEDYEINHVIDEDNGEWFFDDAIAWMPLPEPYKEASE